MTTSVASSGATLPLPMPVPEAVVTPAGNTPAGAMTDGEVEFNDLMVLLAGQNGKQREGGDEAGGEPADDSVTISSQPMQAAPSTPQLQAAVISSLAGLWFAADAQVTSTGNGTGDGGVVATPTPVVNATAVEGGGGLALAGLDVVTTGAQPARPMPLAVVGTETHFAPVIDTASGAAAQTTTVTAPTVAVLGDRLRGMRGSGDAKIRAGDGEAATATLSANDLSAVPVRTVRDTASARDERGTDAPTDGAQAQPVAGEVAADAVDGFAVPDTSEGATSPAKQIANEVARSLAGGTHAPATTLHHLDTRPGLGKLKVLHIQLQPENLGTVTVRLDLKGDRMEMKIEAARAETADLIQRDRDILASIIRSAGYTADDATIAVSHADSGSIVATASGADASTSNSGGGGSQAAGERPGGSEGRDGQSRRNQPRTSQGEQHGGTADRPEGQGIYL